MALNKLSELRSTQEAHEGCTTVALSEPPAEQFQCDQGSRLYGLKENNVRNCVPANVSKRLAPHVLDSLARQCSIPLPHTGAFTGKAQSSSKSSDALYETRHHQQTVEESELVSTFLRALTGAAPSRPQCSSRYIPHLPRCATGSQPQKNDGDILSPGGEPPRKVSFLPDPPSLPIPVSHDVLPSTPAAAGTSTAVNEVSALTGPTDATRSERGSSSVVGEHTKLKTLWYHGNAVKPSLSVPCKDTVAEPPQYPNRLKDMCDLPFPLASQDDLRPHLNDYTTTTFAPPMGCDRKTELALCFSEEVHFSEGCLPCTLSCCTTNRLDVEKEHVLKGTQTLAAVEGRIVELEASAMRSPRRSNNEKIEPLPQILPLASSLPAQICSLPPEYPKERQVSGHVGLCWNATFAESEEDKPIEQQSAGRAEPQCTPAGKKQPMEDNAGLVTQRQMSGAGCYNTAEHCSRVRPCNDDAILPKNEGHPGQAEKVSAFIAALHAFLASGDRYTDVDHKLNTELTAAEVSVRPHPNFKECHHAISIAEQGLTKPEAFPRPTYSEAREPCGIRKDEKTERVVHGTKSNDAASIAVGSTDILERPIYPSPAGSDRTSYCSGITALGSEMSSYAGTSFDRSASYTSCSSFGTGGCSTRGTIMLDPTCTNEHTETEKVDAAGCSSFHETARRPGAECIEGFAAALREKNCPVAARTAVTESEASTFQKLMREFYTDNSRHSVLWVDSDRYLPSRGSLEQGQLIAQRETWKAAAGLTEVMQQVKVLVKRLRGLRLITRETASIPDASRDAICCCLSGDLIPDTINPEETATSTSARWRFEQLLVLSVKMNGSSKDVQGTHVEPPVVRSEEVSGVSIAGLYGFQIQDEVFIVSPVQGLRASSAQALTLMSTAERVKQQRTSDTASDESNIISTYPLVSPPTSFAESSSRHLLWRGWIALLKWQEQRQSREGATVTSIVHDLSNGSPGNYGGVQQSASPQLFPSTCIRGGATTASNGHSVLVNTFKNNAEVILSESTESSKSTTILGQQVGYQTTWKANSSCPSKAGNHRADHLAGGNATLRTWAPAGASEVERGNGRSIVDAFSGYAGVGTRAATCSVVRNAKLARPPTNRHSGQVTDVHSQETSQLLSKQRILEYAVPSLFGDKQVQQLASQSAPESWSPAAKRQSTLPASAGLSEVEKLSSNQLVTALLQCLQSFDVTDDTSTRPKPEGCFWSTLNTWAETNSTNATPQSHPSGLPPPEKCERQLNNPAPELSRAVEWQTGNSLRKELPSSDTVDTRTPPKSSVTGKLGTRKKYWGGESVEAGECGERASGPLSPRPHAERGQEKLEGNSEIEESTHYMGLFREHCTVFISWVPRAARADNLKQKASMEMRLKVLLQMALGVRGIVRVALFPPRGSHCCVHFENPSAASAFIQEYGGPTYTSTTEQFKADICAAYAVALDRGIERVFIRIEEFKPHILQQHLLQQAKDRGLQPLREWHVRRRDCASTSHRFTGGKWRQQHSITFRDRAQPNSAPSIQPFRDSLPPHVTRTPTQMTNGPSSVSLAPWQMRERSPDSCSTRGPQLRPYVSQQLLENVSHRNHRPHHRNK